jgi:hypothetical protein
MAERRFVEIYQLATELDKVGFRAGYYFINGELALSIQKKRGRKL